MYIKYFAKNKSLQFINTYKQYNSYEENTSRNSRGNKSTI